MKTLSIIICFITTIGLNTVVAQQKIDSHSSKVEFKIKGGGLFNVNGSFTGMTGKFSFDPSSLESSTFDICIDAATINTDNDKRDTHLKSADFFEVETYQDICYKSTSIKKDKDGFITTGDLTMHGVTKTVNIPFTFKNNTFEGSLTINRFDYSIGEDYGTFKVGEEAEVTIICKVN